MAGRTNRSAPIVPQAPGHPVAAAMTNQLTAGSWHASDDVVRLLHNETTTAVAATAAAAAAAAAATMAATATATAVTVAAAAHHNIAGPTVAALIAGLVGGADDSAAASAMATISYGDGDDPFEFNRTADDGIAGADDGSAGGSDDEQAKLNYDTGSNFMLLLEDFGEYFYSGTNGTDAAATAAGGAADAAGALSNGTLFDYVVNCTLQQLENGTIACGPPEESEYFGQHIHVG